MRECCFLYKFCYNDIANLAMRSMCVNIPAEEPDLLISRE